MGDSYEYESWSLGDIIPDGTFCCCCRTGGLMKDCTLAIPGETAAIGS